MLLTEKSPGPLTPGKSDDELTVADARHNRKRRREVVLEHPMKVDAILILARAVRPFDLVVVAEETDDPAVEPDPVTGKRRKKK